MHKAFKISLKVENPFCSTKHNGSLNKRKYFPHNIHTHTQLYAINGKLFPFHYFFSAAPGPVIVHEQSTCGTAPAMIISSKYCECIF